MPDAALLRSALFGPVVITVAYLTLYYLAVLNVMRTKLALAREYKARGELFDRYQTHDQRMLAADRVQLNTLEHMPPVLMMLWLDAVLVSPAHATWGGGIYLLTRCVYPFVLGSSVGVGAPTRVLPFTYAGYAATLYLGADLIWACIRSL